MYKFINLETQEFIEVDKQIFDHSKLITETIDGTECPLPKEYYDEITIMTLNDLFVKNISPRGFLIITKMLALMHFLDIQLHVEFLIKKLGMKVHILTDENFDQFVDPKFAQNYDLVALLWQNTMNKKSFFTLSKFNYVNLELNLKENKGITQLDLYYAVHNIKDAVTKIIATGRSDMRDVNMFVNLIELHVDNDENRYLSECGINQNGIQNLTKLRVLVANKNKNIYNVNFMSHLEELYARDECEITQDGIRGLTALRVLDVSNNRKITDVNNFRLLEELDASGMACGIDQKGIKYLTLLKRLKIEHNNKITNIDHMRNLKELSLTNLQSLVLSQPKTINEYLRPYGRQLKSDYDLTFRK